MPAACLAEPPKAQAGACAAAGGQHRRLLCDQCSPPGCLSSESLRPGGKLAPCPSLMSLFDRVSVTQMASASEDHFGTSIWLPFIFYLEGCGCGSSIPRPLLLISWIKHE